MHFDSPNLVPNVPINNVMIGVDEGLVSNRRQAITWTNEDLVYSHIYASLVTDELTRKYQTL